MTHIAKGDRPVRYCVMTIIALFREHHSHFRGSAWPS
jgi:hypothetical protein